MKQQLLYALMATAELAAGCCQLCHAGPREAVAVAIAVDELLQTNTPDLPDQLADDDDRGQAQPSPAPQPAVGCQCGCGRTDCRCAGSGTIATCNALAQATEKSVAKLLTESKAEVAPRKTVPAETAPPQVQLNCPGGVCPLNQPRPQQPALTYQQQTNYQQPANGRWVRGLFGRVRWKANR